jgi:hypothetical protein
MHDPVTVLFPLAKGDWASGLSLVWESEARSVQWPPPTGFDDRGFVSVA